MCRHIKLSRFSHCLLNDQCAMLVIFIKKEITAFDTILLYFNCIKHYNILMLITHILLFFNIIHKCISTTKKNLIFMKMSIYLSNTISPKSPARFVFLTLVLCTT